MAEWQRSARNLDPLLESEWLAVNHLGGYACSTAAGMNTRKYHGLLVAAMTPPARRLVLLSRVEETVRARGWPYPLACNEYPGTIHPEGHQLLCGFKHTPFPRWAYQADGWSLEKSLQLIENTSTVVLTYTLLNSDEPVDFELRPLMALRPIHELMYQWNGRLDAEKVKGKQHHRIPATQRTPEVFFAHDGKFESSGAWYFNTIYRCEQDRGYAGLEDLWSPGAITWTLKPGRSVHFVCSADPIDFEKAIAAAEVHSASISVATEPPDNDLDALLRAANQFLVSLPDEQGVRRSINQLTQFPWSAPSGRDAMIAFSGILLASGKHAQARALLESLASRVKNGLIPTHFSESTGEPSYDGADTSLWFVNALWQYVRYSSDETAGVKRLLDVALDIIQNYRAGTDLGIVADRDGLLISRAPGIGATWMDAKVGDWVITPRNGRPVELNALWYNALRIVAQLCERFGDLRHASELDSLAAGASAAFNRRFWNEAENCCYDLVDDHGPDPAIRPNQLLAISLPFPVLDAARHSAVLERIKCDLLTPFGLRTLAPKEPGYQGRYGGNVVSRDRALHQGSVHPWLLGHYVTALLRVLGRNETTRMIARQLLRPSIEHLRITGTGQLPEMYDGDAPHRPGGAIAAATSVGEVLRAYVEEVLDQAPQPAPAVAITAEVNPAITL